jgi:nucleotide-binding universal stress UspA family protein
LLLGSVAEEVVRHSKRPVLVIGPTAQARDWDINGRKQMKILVATDLGKNSRAAEQYALSLAKRIKAGAVLYHCLGDSYRTILQSNALSGMYPFNLDELLAQIRDDAVASIKEKSRFFQKHGVPCTYIVEEKALSSACAVSQAGGSGYSMIVMGTHGRNALLNAFLGSTARETILNASIPVMTVHSGK